MATTARVLGAITGGGLATLERLILRKNPISVAGQAALSATIRGGGLAPFENFFISSLSAELQAACEGRNINTNF